MTTKDALGNTKDSLQINAFGVTIGPNTSLNMADGEGIISQTGTGTNQLKDTTVKTLKCEGNITLPTSYTARVSGQLGYTLNGTVAVIAPQNYVSGQTYSAMAITLTRGVWNVRAQWCYACANTTTTQALISISTTLNTIDYSNASGDWKSLTTGQYIIQQVNRVLVVSAASQMIYTTVLFFPTETHPRIQTTTTTQPLCNFSAVQIA